MTIQDLQQKYNLSKTDFWELKIKGRSIWIVRHDAVEKIGLAEHIVVDEPVWLACGVGSLGTWAVMVSGYKAEGLNGKAPRLWTTGEASDKNCKQVYPVAMAEKRAKDRLILKLINAYEFGIYSDSEADDFRQRYPTKGELIKTPMPVAFEGNRKGSVATPNQVDGRRDPGYFPDDERREADGVL